MARPSPRSSRARAEVTARGPRPPARTAPWHVATRMTAAHTRGATGSAASPTWYSAPADPITRAVISAARYGDAVNVPGAGEHPSPLGPRGALVGHDRRCKPTGPRSDSDSLRLALDEDGAAVVEHRHAASSIAAGESATAARIASRSSSPSQSSARPATTCAASSRFVSSSSSIRSSSVAVQMRL